MTNQISADRIKKYQKKWHFTLSGDFYTDLAMKESSNNPLAENSLHYLDLYQIGEPALIDAGYYEKVPGAGRWEVNWKGKTAKTAKKIF